MAAFYFKSTDTDSVIVFVDHGITIYDFHYKFIKVCSMYIPEFRIFYYNCCILATAFCLDEIIQEEDDPDSCSVEVYRIITNKMEEIRSLAAGL